MGKNEKEHRKKVAKRNQKLTEDKKRQQKSAMDYLMKLIEKEKQKGAFNNPIQPLPGENETKSNLSNNLDTYSGPQI